MRLLLIVNICMQWALIAALAHRAWGRRLEFAWRTTFFGRARYGVAVWLWELPRGASPNEGRCVVSFNWRDPETIPDYPYIGSARKWALPFGR